MTTSISGNSQRALLVILDGYGITEQNYKNAILHAKTPNLDNFFKDYPFTTIEAGGISVGLPKGVAGNSEVGHMNLGAGRPVRQDLVRINEAIENDSFKNLDGLKKLISVAKSKSKRIHLVGLLSDGGVHSHIDHIKVINSTLQDEGDLDVYLHAFMDGRDTKMDCGAQYITEIESQNNLKFASMQGRSIGMDRDRRWEKIKLSHDTMTGLGEVTSLSPLEYLETEYKEERYDEFIKPVLFDKNSAIEKDDCVFFINFRPDRAIQTTLAFMDPNFTEFKREFIPPFYLCMSPYVPDEVTLPILFDKEKVSGGLSEVLSQKGLKQFKIAETEKYAHITFFFNGGEKTPFKNETQVVVPSPTDVKTYDEKPEMSAYEVTDKLCEALGDKETSFYLVNYANSDMVGHTGKFEAAVKAIEALDQCVQKLIDKCEEENITLLLTADHGNSDQMVYEDGSPHTSHTKSLVPFAVYNPSLKNAKIELNEGHFSLQDIAPTILHVMGIEKAQSFTGKPIFK
jgi:2,3-bisphosphoglycerate-independent phosphoglycerate mutase